MNNSMQFSMLIEDEIKGLLQTKKALEKQLVQQFNQSLANKNALKQQRRDRLRDLFKLSNKLLEVEEKNVQLQHQVNTAQKVKIQNANLLQELNEHKAKITNFQKQVQQLNGELKLCQSKINDLEQKNIQSEQVFSKIKDLQEKYLQSQQVKVSFSNQLTQLKVLLQNAQQQLDDQKAISKSSNDLTTEQNTKYLQQIDYLKSLNDQLRSKFQLLSQQNHQWKQKHQQSLDALKNQYSINASQVQQLKNKLISKQCQLKTLYQQILESNKTIDAINHESKKLYTEINQLKEQDSALKSTFETLNQDLKNYKEKSLGLAKMNKELFETIEKLRGKKLKTQTVPK